MSPKRYTIYVAAICLFVSGLIACSDLLTEPAGEGELFDSPVEGLTQAELAIFARGDEEFNRRFVVSDGLGPIFNNTSCISCHSGDGRGRLENALQRIGTPADGMLGDLGGPQIQNKAIPGALFEQLPTGHPVSLRLPPPVFGAGLIEGIPDAAILANVDSTDADGDGISGRPNWVTPPEYVGSSTRRLGRFGRKAQVSSLMQQVVEAYHQDMGITTEQLPSENRNPLAGIAYDAADLIADPEIPATIVHAVTNYVRMLAPSAPGADTPQRIEGGQLFLQVQCAKCHVPQMTTGPNTIAGLSNKTVTLYSDLLLHDMGDALADSRPDGDANGREWRTTPLWGLRLMRRFLNGDAFLMHDGRAKSVDEAIRLHGGEAQQSRNLYVNLTAQQRAALLDFVESR